MQHASPEESSAMLLLKMLQPDEGIMALGRILWGLAKASGVNRLVLLCVVLNGRYIAQWWCFISITMTKVISYPKGVFCVATQCLHRNTVFLYLCHSDYVANSIDIQQNTQEVLLCKLFITAWYKLPIIFTFKTHGDKLFLPRWMIYTANFLPFWVRTLPNILANGFFKNFHC